MIEDFTYDSTKFLNVTEEYVNTNALIYKGKNINPANFPNSAFFIILNSSILKNDNDEIYGASGGLYIVITGIDSNTSGIDIIKLDGLTEIIRPTLKKTTSGGVYVVWSDTAIAYIRATIFKLSR